MNQAGLVIYEFLPTVNLIRSGFITESTEPQFFIKRRSCFQDKEMELMGFLLSGTHSAVQTLTTGSE